MAADIGVRLGVEGEKAFRSSISAVNAQIKALGTEMAAVSAQFSENANSQKALAAKNEVLGRSIASTKDKISVLDGQLARQTEKLQGLGRALDEAAEKYGATSNEALKAQNAYNNQAKTVMNLQAQLNSATADLKNMENAVKSNRDAMQESSSYFKTFADGLKSGFAAAAKAAAVGAAAVATATGTLVKGAVDAYGEYEQLTGGVETLFKESGTQVTDYAQNAFKSAGLSANEYMETVTGFSASLLQSLGGDTEKAAAMADQAITDMADNSNKMGTAMDSIQNAYQGFAKQNYTMLDNLKLGYGGTKEEMERLLADAEKLTGMKFDISSFGDIVQAIHAVQTQMGITGTTALEAEQTIQGSTAAMKAAWENLKVGLADSSQDMSQLMTNFVTSAETAARNVLPRIAEALQNIGPMLQAALQQDVVGRLPEIAQSGVQFAASLGQGILSGLPALRATAVDLIGRLSDYLRENLPNLISSGLTLLSGLSASLRENVGLLVDSGIELAKSVAKGLADGLPAMLENIPVIVSNLANTINDNVPKILAAGVEIVLTLGKGMIQAIPALIQNLPAIIGAIWDTITAVNWINLGGKIISGLGNGISGMKDFILEKVLSIRDAVSGGFRNLVTSAKNWGIDLIKNFASGIMERLSSLKTTLASAAQTVADFLGFSEPKKGPLSNFHTFAPDMMALFMEGINQNQGALQQTLANAFSLPENAIRQSYVDVAANAAGRPGGQSVTRDDIGELLAGAVNGLRTAEGAAGGYPTLDVTLMLNDRVLAEEMVEPLRAADRANPATLDDKR